MRIIVLNGSPKGDLSVTLQYVHFIQKKFPQHELKIVNIVPRIKALESDAASFQAILDEVRAADGVLWAFPLYVMLVHAGYKRFIELVFERAGQDAFRGKYAAVLSTSIKFYDHTAHDYMHSICDDLDMQYVGGYSAAMYDLQQSSEQDRLLGFAADFLDAMANRRPTVKAYLPLSSRSPDYAPGPATHQVATGERKVLVVTDAEPGQANLLHMIERFRAAFSAPVEVVNLHDVDIKGGCLGCIRCGYDNQCAYEGKDGFIEFYRTKVQTADIVVFAGAIRDRYLSATWKNYLDRRFFNSHQFTLPGRQIAYLVSGPLAHVANLRQMLTALVDLERANLVGIVTDEPADPAAIDAQLDTLAAGLVRAAERAYVAPPTFLQVGGMKIFRDEIWGHMRIPFQADHRAYRRQGIYDFPQYDYRTRVQNAFFGLLLHIPRVRREFQKQIKTGMIAPLKKVVDALPVSQEKSGQETVCISVLGAQSRS
jgi:multimeric flavodoxin WrbA